jgi:hypothetical protein
MGRTPTPVRERQQKHKNMRCCVMACKMGQLLIGLFILLCISFRLEKLRSYIRRSLMSKSVKTIDHGGGIES